MQLGIQPTSQFPHGRLVGAPDRHCQKNPRFNVSPAENTFNPRSSLHTNGRSYCYHKCTTTSTRVCRPRTAFHTFTINAPHTEDRSSASSRRLYGQGLVHKTMETSSGSRKPVLDPLETRILTLLTTQAKVDSTSQKPTSGRSGSAQGQADISQLLAHGQNFSHISWKGWPCKKG